MSRQAHIKTLTAAMAGTLENFRDEMSLELVSIFDYWSRNTIDKVHHGFTGRIDQYNQVVKDAPKGAVLNARILWSCSAAHQLTGDPKYRELADRAYNAFTNSFIDTVYGGVYWTVDAAGKPLDDKKQIYALAFAIYGLSEYARCSNNNMAKQQAIDLYKTIVSKAFDVKNIGYAEAFSRDFSHLPDARLSEKDEDFPRSMNTHLHIIEAFTNLYVCWPDAELKSSIEELLDIFSDHIIDVKTHHLILFSHSNWNPASEVISFGHDVEAAWLLLEAAVAIGDNSKIESMKNFAVIIAEAAAKGLDKDGGLWYEFNPGSQHMTKEKHWWPQAEAIVGFFNAWEITGNEAWLQKSLSGWMFTRQYIVDKDAGEWFWGVDENNQPMKDQDKVGMWKCPYHNSRACMEIIKRINRILAA